MPVWGPAACSGRRRGQVALLRRAGWGPTFASLAPADDLYPKIYHSCFFVVTYLAPLGLMAMAYFQIFRKLWGRQVRPTLLSLSGLGAGRALPSEHAILAAARERKGPGTLKLKAEVVEPTLELNGNEHLLVSVAAIDCPMHFPLILDPLNHRILPPTSHRRKQTQRGKATPPNPSARKGKARHSVPDRWGPVLRSAAPPCCLPHHALCSQCLRNRLTKAAISPLYRR